VATLGSTVGAATTRRASGRAILGLTCATHFVHDGFSDLVYMLLPIWASEFRLNYVQVGALRTVYTGGMALFQLPAGLLAERYGERSLLAGGTAITAAGFVLTGWAGSVTSLFGLLLLAGLASGVQHPLSSTLVSGAYEPHTRRTALGTYNFSGDLGKMVVPAAVGLAATAVGWRVASSACGVIGIAAALILFVMLREFSVGSRPQAARVTSPPAGWGIRNRPAFSALAAIGALDSGTRTPFLTFLPFVLIAKGSTTAGIGMALALAFAGGAAGKLLCGLLAQRVGVIRAVVVTEAATCAGIITLVVAPLPMALAILPFLGAALNGTSSVLYGTVADLVVAERQSRAYGLYYTLIQISSAVSPIGYGWISDRAGASMTLVLVGTVVLATIPLALSLRRAIDHAGELARPATPG
jgi:MFS transporter, FSR family, fosmidomycin resistance protein